MKTTLKTRLATFAFSALTASTFAQTPLYQVTDLGAVNGASEAFAINNNDQVVGWSFLNNGTYGAMLWQNGTKKILSSVGGTSAAYAINDQGVIVGKRGTHGVMFTAPNVVRDFGTLGGQESTALGINENGDVSMGAQKNDANWHGAEARWNQVMPLIDLKTLGGLWSGAQDVNNVNVHCGWSHTTAGPTHATLFSPGYPSQDLKTLGGPQSEAKSINDYFGVTGWSDLAKKHVTPNYFGNVRRAFLWDPMLGMKDLGEPYSAGRPIRTDAAGRKFFQIIIQMGEIRQTVNVYGVDTYGYGISSDNTVCGYARLYLGPTPKQVDRAIVAINSKMYDLNKLIGNQMFEWNLDHAWGINDSGTIVGRGYNYRTGSFRAFMARRIQ